MSSGFPLRVQTPLGAAPEVRDLRGPVRTVDIQLDEQCLCGASDLRAQSPFESFAFRFRKIHKLF